MLEKHRSSIYRSLVPILGEEETEAMLTYFPVRDDDEPLTRADLRVGMADLRAEMAELASELRAEMGELRTEMGELRTDMAELRAEMHMLANRTTVWLCTTILGAAGLVIAFS